MEKTKELNRSLFEVRKYAFSRDAQTLLNMMNHFVNNFDPYKPLPPNLDNEYKTIMNPLLLIIGFKIWFS